MNKKYRYRDGEPARVLCIDSGNKSLPVVSIRLDGKIYSHTIDGLLFSTIKEESCYDLIEVCDPAKDEWSLFTHKSNINDNKKWFDAFIGHYGKDISYQIYSTAHSICISSIDNCTKYQMLMAYAIQFKHGGFWLVNGVMYVVTAGIGSDEDSSYDDAVKFIKNWKSSLKEENHEQD